jgi:Synergist-CTERM protein sorting domain-containing protein
MKRTLLAAAAVAPLAVLAAIATAPSGMVVDLDNFNAEDTTSYINAAQCADTIAAPPLNLEWSTITSSAVGDSYQLYASSAAPATSGEGANLCATEDIPGSDGTATIFAGPIAGGGAWTSNIQRGQASGAEAKDQAGRTCTENQVVYICAHLLDGSNPVGYASGKFIVQIAAPNAPTVTDVGAASETRLSVSWAAPTSTPVAVDHYVAVATAAGESPHESSSVDAVSRDVIISGLTQGTTYSVVVRAYSVGGNPSPDSNTMDGTPGPVDDFWETYVNAGGRDDGGCASGSAGPLALLAVAALVLLRRRS